MHTRVDNYDNPLWPLVYDAHRGERLRMETAWYAERAGGRGGECLVASCATGTLLLHLLERGVDAHGFDISAGMIAALYAKARARGVADIRRRVTRQDLIEFRYDRTFRDILIPGRSFLHLATQDDQIACLANARAHLEPGGRLLLNVFQVDHRRLIEDARGGSEFRPVGAYPHPDDAARSIELSLRQRNDLVRQTMHLTWRFRERGAPGKETESRMVLRYILPEEFRLLFRIAGFRAATAAGDFDGSELSADSPEQIWIAEA